MRGFCQVVFFLSGVALFGALAVDDEAAAVRGGVLDMDNHRLKPRGPGTKRIPC